MDIQETKLEHQTATPNKIELQYLKKITNQFSEDLILGSGGFGTVYKGEKENGKVVAVKRLKDMPGMNDKKFLNEVKLVMDISHPNIVRFEGYCYQIEGELMPFNGSHVIVDKTYRLLCFEYLPLGSLDEHLTDESSGMDWHVRYSIIHGICKGLYCLHEGRPGTPILHLDLKPANVLLDEQMIPKIADFGQSRLFGEGKTHCTATSIVGSCGYMAPEYIERGMLTKESDIYSLGVILMEILTGVKKHPESTTAQEFSEVKNKWRRRLRATLNNTSLEEECEQVDLCIKIGLKCMERDPKNRPNIKEIIDILGPCENMNSHSFREDGSDVEEQSWDVVPLEWRDALHVVALRSPDQSIKGMEVIFHELLRIFETETTVPKYIIKDADRLVSYLSAMAEKTCRLILSGASSMSVVHIVGKYTITTLTQAFKIAQLAQALKMGTLEILFRDLLIWSTVNKDGELSYCLERLIRKIQENAEIISMLLALMNLLRPLDSSRWPSPATPVPLAESNRIYSNIVAECLDIVAKNFPETIGEFDLDRIFSSIQIYLEELGLAEIQRREETKDCRLVAVMKVLAELVYLQGPLIKDHHSMVCVDGDTQPIILAYIDSFLKTMEEGGTSSAYPKEDGGAYVQYKAKVTRIGPWGAGGGTARDVDAEPRYLNSIIIRSDAVIISLAFSYIDGDGKPRHGGTWGSHGANLIGNMDTIQLGPSEFLKEISGTVGPWTEFSTNVLTSLTFITNKSTYGPFGRVEGTHFSSPVLRNKSIVGFFAHAEACVDAIGVYVSRGMQTMKEKVSVRKIGPWGGHGGEACDLKVVPQRLLSVVLHTNWGAVERIEFTYIDSEGQQRTAGPWGGGAQIGGTPHTIALGPSEFLKEISGTIGRCDKPNVIEGALVRSVRFVTNVGSYGPFGGEGGATFHSTALGNGSIIGFFGNAAWMLDAIGVYVG